MPVMDGISAVREIRKTFNNLPIIGLTGESIESETLKFLDAGANIVLVKPAKVSELSYHLKNLIKNEVDQSLSPDSLPSSILPFVEKKHV